MVSLRRSTSSSSSKKQQVVEDTSVAGDSGDVSNQTADRIEEATTSTTTEAPQSDDETSSSRRRRFANAWDRRRRRRRSSKKLSESTIVESEQPLNIKEDEDDDLDPYESDPGESYRQHCLRFNGKHARSCLRIPAFLKSHKAVTRKDEETISTAPPSPLASETEDVLNQVPRSLPPTASLVRYSLRTSIGDGSEKQPSGPTVMERRQLRPNGISLNVSHWSDTGCRPYMEDRYAIEDLGQVQVEFSPVAVKTPENDIVEVTYGSEARQNRRFDMPLTWLGVFDGHGGDKASQYCVDWLSSYVRKEDAFPYDLGFAMKSAFTNIDDDFVGSGYPDGTTACTVSLVGGRRIVCANAGDSRAIVVRKDASIVRLSRDHKPGMPDETRRISELGGRVIYWGRWRVEGLLAVSRSIGDGSLKPYITAEPEVCEYDIGKDDWFLVISSDGVWDVVDNEEAAHVVLASSCVVEDGELKIDTNRFKKAAKNLCDHARSCGSTDNFSVIIADLRSCGNQAAASGRYSPT